MRYHDDHVERVGPGRYDIADLGVLNIGILRSVINIPRQTAICSAFTYMHMYKKYIYIYIYIYIFIKEEDRLKIHHLSDHHEPISLTISFSLFFFTRILARHGPSAKLVGYTGTLYYKQRWQS